ncbi:hypothetical protein [Sphingobacterium kyonggiense]
MIRIIFLLCIVWLFGCNGRDRSIEKNEFSLNELYNSDVKRLKDSVFFKGDTLAYDALSVYYIDYSIPSEFMFYSLVMANKYKYPQSFYDVFLNICRMYNNDTEQMDDASAKMAIIYLLQASELGHHQAREEVMSSNIKEEEDSKDVLKRILEKN